MTKQFVLETTYSGFLGVTSPVLRHVHIEVCEIRLRTTRYNGKGNIGIAPFLVFANLATVKTL